MCFHKCEQDRTAHIDGEGLGHNLVLQLKLSELSTSCFALPVSLALTPIVQSIK